MIWNETAAAERTYVYTTINFSANTDQSPCASINNIENVFPLNIPPCRHRGAPVVADGFITF